VKIVTIVGARPQFVKAATVSRAIRAHNRECSDDGIVEVMIHTGQHFDENMSQVFFDELDIPHPAYNLDISGGAHGLMTGRMLEHIESVLMDEKPDWVLIYGDTNSTLAGALAASKLNIPIAHVEAGLRSFNMRMPEEINRILSDRVSTLLFCPTEQAVQNLKSEGLKKGVLKVGDVMYDASLFYRELGQKKSSIMSHYSLVPKGFVLATCHRAENTDDVVRLGGIVDGLALLAQRTRVIFPLHPRTRKVLLASGLLEKLGAVEIVEPVSFIEMVQLEAAATVIVTDSGGVQKEAYFFAVPCITMRDETEWVETVALGANVLVGSDCDAILAAYVNLERDRGWNTDQGLYGDGHASELIISHLLSYGGGFDD